MVFAAITLLPPSLFLFLFLFLFLSVPFLFAFFSSIPVMLSRPPTSVEYLTRRFVLRFYLSPSLDKCFWEVYIFCCTRFFAVYVPVCIFLLYSYCALSRPSPSTLALSITILILISHHTSPPQHPHTPFPPRPTPAGTESTAPREG